MNDLLGLKEITDKLTKDGVKVALTNDTYLKITLMIIGSVVISYALVLMLKDLLKSK